MLVAATSLSEQDLWLRGVFWLFSQQVEECALINAEGMRKLESHRFVTPGEITDSGKDHQSMNSLDD